MSTQFRYYQSDADMAIYNELLINDKCLVKMFCGTGKSLLMRHCISAQNTRLLVYVFPSLSLLDQFCNDYFEPDCCPFKISSNDDSTTEDIAIQHELRKTTTTNRIICVTYQSYETLLSNLGTIKINMCIYDEAHHAFAETYQEHIFVNGPSTCEKQIFFTATPNPKKDNTMCGKLVYDYTYLQGLNDN
jgi:superfamily II DNA or RNA helicase